VRAEGGAISLAGFRTVRSFGLSFRLPARELVFFA